MQTSVHLFSSLGAWALLLGKGPAPEQLDALPNTSGSPETLGCGQMAAVCFLEAADIILMPAVRTQKGESGNTGL